jgi:hypothetical protein
MAQAAAGKRVAQALHATLAIVTERDIRPSMNSQAFAAYRQGRFFYNRRAPGDVEMAVKLFEVAANAATQAAAQDGRCALVRS